MHQTVGNILRILLHGNPPTNMSQARDIVDQAHSQAMHAMRTTVITTLGSPPGAMNFSREMFHNVPLVDDWLKISRHREQRVNDDLRRANMQRRPMDYAPGQQVLKLVDTPTSLRLRISGPYTIERVHVIGNRTISLRPGVTESINIHRVLPYY